MNNDQIRLTLCFFEHPAAISEIDYWERSNTERIRSKRLDGRLTMFTVGLAHPAEFLVCIPLDTLNTVGFTPAVMERRIRAYAEEEVGTSTFSTVKYLIFGRVHPADLDHVRSFMDHEWRTRGEAVSGGEAASMPA